MPELDGSLSDLQILSLDDGPLPPAPEVTSNESAETSSSNSQENAEQTLPVDEAAPSPGKTQTTPEATQQEQAQALTEQPSLEDDSWVEDVVRAYPIRKTTQGFPRGVQIFR